MVGNDRPVVLVDRIGPAVQDAVFEMKEGGISLSGTVVSASFMGRSRTAAEIVLRHSPEGPSCGPS